MKEILPFQWGSRSSQLSFMKESAAPTIEINVSFVTGAAAPSGYPLLKGRPPSCENRYRP
jgi:hypothetical protein